MSDRTFLGGPAGAPRAAASVPSWCWALLPIVAMAFCRDLWAPDEPRYAEVAREAVTRDWLVMHRCGELYPDKPPLFYWSIGLVGLATGFRVGFMRLVSVAAMAGVAALTARFARRSWGQAEARWAPLLFLGFALVAWLAGRIQIDPLLCLCCVGALEIASAPGVSSRAQAGRRALACGLATGLGVLAKGPVALVIVGSVLLSWRLPSARLGEGAASPRAKGSAVFGAILLAILPAALWAGAASWREPRLVRPLFFGQHMGRVLEGKAHHGPPWEHLLELPAFLLPWTLPVVLGLASAWRARRAARSAAAARDVGLARAALWFGVLFLFFSAIPTKRELYLLPAYPAAALLGARWLATALARERWPRGVGIFGTALFALLGLALAVAGFVAPGKVAGLTDLSWQGLACGAVFLAGAAWGARELAAARPAGWARASALTWSLGLTAVGVLILPAMDAFKSARGLAERAAALPQRPAEIPCFSIQPDGYRFYSGLPFTLGGRSGEPLLAELEGACTAAGDQFLALLRNDAWASVPAAERARLGLVELAREPGDSRYGILVGTRD